MLDQFLSFPYLSQSTSQVIGDQLANDAWMPEHECREVKYFSSQHQHHPQVEDGPQAHGLHDVAGLGLEL